MFCTYILSLLWRVLIWFDHISSTTNPCTNKLFFKKHCCVASTITEPYCKPWTLVNIGFSAISGDSTAFCFGLKSTELCCLFWVVRRGFWIKYVQLMPKRNRSESLVVAVQFFQRKLIEFPWEHRIRVLMHGLQMPANNVGLEFIEHLWPFISSHLASQGKTCTGLCCPEIREM